MHAHARTRWQRRFVLLSTKVLESVHQVELGLNINSSALLEVGTALWSTVGTACRRCIPLVAVGVIVPCSSFGRWFMCHFIYSARVVSESLQRSADAD